MLFKLFTNSSQSSQRSSALNVGGLDDFLSANLSFLCGARGEVSWSRAASPVSSADDKVMRCNMMYECLDNVHGHSSVAMIKLEALGASTWLVSLKVTLISGSVSATTQLMSLMVTLLLCFGWGSWKESFLSLLGFLASFAMKHLLGWGCCHDSFALNLSLSGRCLLSLASL